MGHEDMLFNFDGREKRKIPCPGSAVRIQTTWMDTWPKQGASRSQEGAWARLIERRPSPWSGGDEAFQVCEAFAARIHMYAHKAKDTFQLPMLQNDISG